MTQGAGLIPCCWLFRTPFATPVCCHCCPGAPQAWQSLQSAWGAASPQGTIPILVCSNELTGLC